MKRLVFGAALLCSAQSAVAAKFVMQLIPAANQVARFQSGVAAVDSQTETVSVRFIQHEGNIKKRGSIQLLLMNQGREPFNVGPENVSAKLADGTPVSIITYDQLIKEEKKRQMWAAVAAGLSAASNSMNAANAGYVSGMATYRGSTFGSFGSTPYSATTYGTTTVSGYDSGRARIAQSLANQQNQANFARLAENNANKIAALKVNMRTTTVDPGDMFGGTVIFELPKSAQKSKTQIPVTFVVNANGQEHTFQANFVPR